MLTTIIAPDDIDFNAYERETEARQKIRSASVYLDVMARELGTPSAQTPGFDLPWEKARGMFRFHPGEVTLWSGANGSGKSLITGMVALDMVCQGERTCIASFEMPVKKTLGRMVQNWVGMNPHTYSSHHDGEGALRELYSQLSELTKSRLWMYDQLGSVKPDKAISVVRYCAKELGMQQFFLDSLMKCVPGTDDYNAQKDFVNELCTVAKDYGISIHLVSHTRKLSDEGKRPDKYAVAGAGDITNLVDNVLLFWRNKPKEAERRSGGNRLDGEPDAILTCCKQRELGEEPEFALWYDKESQSYTETLERQPIYWPRRVL